ncbi:hypothetical protein R4B61_02960 [Fructilactobacillus vespulae]|uniref:hypothetical protein n=1 Tax=Fructilactobacillus vespulae TaxID=1249630 RepID=UPI0039B3C4EA
MKKSINKILSSNIFIYFSFLVLTLVQIKPFVTRNLMLKNWGNSIDLSFHFSRFISMNHILNHPINYTLFSNTGNGTNLFYPWIFIYPSSLIGNFINNYVIGYVSIFILVTLVSFIIYFHCGNYFFDSKKLGYLFSVFYSFSIHRIVYGYFKNDFGQYIAMSFLPLAFIYWYRIVFKKENKWVELAVSMSLIAFSHVLTTMLVVLFLLLLSIIFLNKSLNKKVINNFFKGILLSILLTSFMWMTLLQQVIFVGNLRPFIINLQNYAMTLNEIFQTSLNNEAMSEGSIGIVGLFTIIIASFFIKNSDKSFKFFYFLSLTLIIVSSKIFPWFIFQNTPMNIIQVPARITEFTSLFLSVLLVLSLKKIYFITEKKVIFITFLVVIISFTSTNIRVQSFLQNQNNIVANSDDICKIVDNFNTNDYVPILSSSGLYPTWGGLAEEYHIKQSITDKESFINHKKADIKPKYTADKVSIDLKSNTKTSTLDIPVYYYEGTYAKIDGKRTQVKESDRGTVEVKVPKNTHKVEITNEYTPLAKAAAVVSIVTWLSVLGVYLKRKFKK